jgi:aspartyl-tRNA(Asn)/glutamyl-tRNA(Gln) amidotransferase subunit B
MYKVVIGLEVHCELKTNSKNFSGAKNIYSEIPNSHVSVVDLGFPGTLPVVNKEAVKKALKVALALNCEIPDEVIFDRKNYFYPDLPKGYQITQAKKPMGRNGYLMINVNDIDKKIGIRQLHLEEDTASLDHYGTYSLIDYNRSGVPLIEIVTEPCMNSAAEALAFLESLRSIFLYCDVSEAKSDKGQMRCDVNISLMKEDAKEFGTKVELKNINSFTNVKDAIEYEIKRQSEILDQGGKILQETRRFDDQDMKTYSMRSKVDAIDYKYYVEPNIPPVKISKEYLEEIKKEIPPLQYERINTYMNEYGLSRYDATVLVREKAIAEYFEATIREGADPKLASNWITAIILGHLNKFELSINDIFITPKMLTNLIKMVNDKTISIKQGKEVLYKALDEKKDPTVIVKESGMKQIIDVDAIKNWVMEVLDEMPEAITQYKNGKTNIIDYLVGQVMKKSRGQANPAMTMSMLKEEIEKR